MIGMGRLVFGYSPWRTEIGLLDGRATWKASGTVNGLKQMEL